jgi:phytanoyl-CoA hydroxylase
MLTEPQRTAWHDDGFLVLRGFLDDGATRSLNEAVDRAWATRARDDNPLVADVWLDDAARARRLPFRDVPDDARAHPHKLNDLYLVDPAVRDVTLSRPLARILGELVDSDVAICNSLNLEWGSEQPYHFDTYYMPGPRPDGMVATSICLEDHHHDAGPLTYYPGSHRIPAYRFSHGERHAAMDEMDAAADYARREIDARGLEPVDFEGSAGDVVVWHEQLYHGGGAIADRQRTRRTLVTHYWCRDGLTLAPEARLAKIGRHRFYIDRPHQPVPA